MWSIVAHRFQPHKGELIAVFWINYSLAASPPSSRSKQQTKDAHPADLEYTHRVPFTIIVLMPTLGKGGQSWPNKSRGTCLFLWQGEQQGHT